MKHITLSKARKLDKEIGNVLNTQLKTNFKISKFKTAEDLQHEYDDNFKSFNHSYEKILDLCSFKFKLRNDIQRLNNEDISDLLNLKQKLTTQITIISNLIYNVEDSVERGCSDLNIINAKMKKESDPNSYHSDDTIDYIVINRDMINDMKSKINFLKGGVSSIDDSLLKLNNTITLDLSELNIELLNEFNIIVKNNHFW